MGRRPISDARVGAWYGLAACVILGLLAMGYVAVFG